MKSLVWLHVASGSESQVNCVLSSKKEMVLTDHVKTTTQNMVHPINTFSICSLTFSLTATSGPLSSTGSSQVSAWCAFISSPIWSYLLCSHHACTACSAGSSFWPSPWQAFLHVSHTVSLLVWFDFLKCSLSSAFLHLAVAVSNSLIFTGTFLRLSLLIVDVVF